MKKRWAEHYQELYSRENIVTDTAIDSTSLLPVMNKLDVPPSVNELRKAINSLACGKAPGNDGVRGHKGWYEYGSPLPST